MVAEFREEVRIHFEQVHEHLNEIEHQNYLYFESLSFQLDLILEQAKDFRRAQHADFFALKGHIEQIGRELGYDTSSIATLPLFQLYDRAQDIYNQRLQKPILSRSEIDRVHREILGPLSSWAGSTPHGIFNGLRYESSAGGSPRDVRVDSEVFSKEPYSVVAYLTNFAKEIGILAKSENYEDLPSPHLWLEATKAYLDLRKRTSLPSPGVEPHHISQMMNRGRKLVSTIDQIHQNPETLKTLLKRRNQTTMELKRLISKKRTELQVKFAKDYLLSYANKQLERIVNQLGLVQSVSFTLSDEWWAIQRFSGDDSGFPGRRHGYLNQLHELKRAELVDRYRAAIAKIERLQDLLRAESDPTRAIRVAGDLVVASRIVRLNLIGNGRNLIFDVPFTSQRKGESPRDGYASQKWQDVVSFPELFGLGVYDFHVDITWTPCELKQMDLGLNGNAPYWYDYRDRGETDRNRFRHNRLADKAFEYTLTTKISFHLNSELETNGSVPLASIRTFNLATTPQVDPRLEELGSTVKAEMERLTNWGRIPNIENLFLPSSRIADSVWGISLPSRLVSEFLDLRAPSLLNKSLMDDLETKKFGMDMYKIWLSKVMQSLSHRDDALSVSNLDLAIESKKAEYVRDVRAIETISRLVGYMKDWSPLYMIIKGESMITLTDPWLTEESEIDDLTSQARFPSELNHRTMTAVRMRLLELSQLGLERYSENRELNDAVNITLGDTQYTALKADIEPKHEGISGESSSGKSTDGVEERIRVLENDMQSIKLGQAQLRESVEEMKLSLIDNFEAIKSFLRSVWDK